jgi:hypothetical protein
MGFRYEWRYLTKEGRLESPNPLGPYYDEVYVNPRCGFASISEATDHLQKIKEHVYNEYVLVSFYSPD